MPEPQAHRSRVRHALGVRCRRRPRAAAYLTVAGVLGLALTPSLAGGAAVADTTGSPCFAQFATTSAADIVVLRQLDFAPLGSSVTRSQEVLIGSSRAGLYAGASPLAAARAGLFGPTDTRPDMYTYQIAPPTVGEPAARTVGASDDGHIHTGTRRLSSRAALTDPAQCDDAAAEASVNVLTDSTIDGTDGVVLRLPGGADTLTQAAFVTGSGYYSVAGAATATVPDLTLFGASVRVLGKPSLRVGASGFENTSVVRYLAPSLSVSTPSSGGYRPVADHQDLVAPINSLAAGETARLVREGALRLPTTAFADFLASFGAPVPALATRNDGAARSMVVRVSPGQLAQQNSGWMVHALASAVRMQVLLRTTSSSGATTEVQLADIAVGSVEVLAFAPYGGLASQQTTNKPTIINLDEDPDPSTGGNSGGPDGPSSKPAGQDGNGSGSGATGGTGQGVSAGQGNASGGNAAGRRGNAANDGDGDQRDGASGSVTSAGSDDHADSTEQRAVGGPDGDPTGDDEGDQQSRAAGHGGGEPGAGIERPTSLREQRLRVVIVISAVLLAAAFGLVVAPTVQNLVTARLGRRGSRRR